MNGDTPDSLDAVLNLAVSAKFITKTARASAVAHSLGYSVLLQNYGINEFVDLGSGGGIPSLPILWYRKDSRALLIESNKRKANFLSRSLYTIGAHTRAIVINDRAENVATNIEFREKFNAVTARSFAPPSITLECAVGILSVGGLLIVSEPDGRDVHDRWPEAGLSKLGCKLNLAVEQNSFHYVVIEKIQPTSDRFPRRVGIPWKRPLF